MCLYMETYAHLETNPIDATPYPYASLARLSLTLGDSIEYCECGCSMVWTSGIGYTCPECGAIIETE